MNSCTFNSYSLPLYRRAGANAENLVICVFQIQYSCELMLLHAALLHVLRHFEFFGKPRENTALPGKSYHPISKTYGAQSAECKRHGATSFFHCRVLHFLCSHLLHLCVQVPFLVILLRYLTLDNPALLLTSFSSLSMLLAMSIIFIFCNKQVRFNGPHKK